MSFLTRRCSVVVGACVAILCVEYASAATIVTHSGNTDPTTESPAWALSAGGAGTAGSGVTHLGEPAWKMTDPAGGNDWAYYRYSPTLADFSDPTGWTVEWRMAAENLETLAGGDDEAAIHIRDGFHIMTFTLRVNGTGAGDGATLTQRFGNTSLKGDIPTIGSRATGFHTFALDYDGTPGGGGLYRLFYDNTLVTDSSNTPGLPGTLSNAAPVLQWGGLGGKTGHAQNVDSYWNFVQLRTGTYIVPEPGSLVMISMGSIGLAVCARRRWKKCSK